MHRCCAGLIGLLSLFTATSVPAQSGLSLTRTDSAGTALYSNFAYASKNNRSLQAGGWTFQQTFTPRVTLWYGRQNILATGQFKGDKFSTDADTMGARINLSRTDFRGWTVEFDGYHSGSGVLQAPNNHLAAPGEITRGTFPGTSTNSLWMHYAFGPTPTGTSAAHNLPTFSLRANVNHVEGTGRSSDALGVGAGSLFKITSSLTGDVELTGFFERPSGLINGPGNSIKPHLVAGLVYKPVRWLKLLANFDFLPLGLPYGGTALSGLSGYALYQPSSAPFGLQKSAIGDVNLQMQVSSRF